MFRDRQTAAITLAGSLQRFKSSHPLILASDRTGIVLATTIAEALDTDADIFLFAEIYSPGAVPACLAVVNEFGDQQVYKAVEEASLPTDYVSDRMRLEIANLREKRNQYTPEMPPVDPARRTVILVDDGIVTGATVCGTIPALRLRNPSKIIAAAPVAREDGLQKARENADEVVVLQVPGSFQTLSEHYDELPTIGTDESSRMLLSSRIRARRRAA